MPAELPDQTEFHGSGYHGCTNLYRIVRRAIRDSEDTLAGTLSIGKPMSSDQKSHIKALIVVERLRAEGFLFPSHQKLKLPKDGT